MILSTELTKALHKYEFYLNMHCLIVAEWIVRIYSELTWRHSICVHVICGITTISLLSVDEMIIKYKAEKSTMPKMQ